MTAASQVRLRDQWFEYADVLMDVQLGYACNVQCDYCSITDEMRRENMTIASVMDKLADALKQLETQIPEDIAWVMRIDGHTDIRPITNALFPSNWELSSARAISVARYLIDRGVPPNRLVAAGFGEFQPLQAGDSDEDLAKNRRIELKLTER